MYDRIYPGAEMFDIDGKRIYIQFPHIISHNGKFYLYGSNREFTDGKSKIWHWGIKMYESDDLYNWKDLGMIIPPDEQDKDSLLNPYSIMDAPCLIYNEKTKKWVFWMIHMDKQTAHTFVADQLTGPYTSTGSGFFPCGFKVGDFDLAHGKKGKAYIYFNNPHTQIVCAELTEDFTNVTGKYTTILHHPESVPFAREAPAHFERNGKHYLITSGTTGFFPNPSEIAIADAHMTDYINLGDPHVGDETQSSFHSQIRSVFKHPTKELYIALADRWLPDDMHVPYQMIFDYYFAHWQIRTPEAIAKAEAAFTEINVNPKTEEQNISRARCVFLPITFEGEKPTIHWKDSWKIEDFE